MQGLVKDVQKEAFYRLVNETIPNTISNTRYTIGDCELTFKPLEAGNQIILEDDRGTEYYSIKAVCFLCDTITGEEVEFNVELLKVPVLQELGFKIKGNYMQQLDVYERAVGWNFYQDKRNGECASLITENKKSLYFNHTGHGSIVRILTHGENKKVKLGVSTLFRVLAGCSNEELMSIFGYSNPYVIEAFSTRGDNSSIDNCIRLVAKAVLNNDKVESSTVLNLKKEIETNLFSETYFPLGSSNASRFNHFQSFSYRANGRILAESVECNG